MLAQEAVEIVCAVKNSLTEKAIKRIPIDLLDTHPYSSLALWMYVLRGHHDPEGESCPYCKMFDGETFTGSQLRTVFPDHQWADPDIYPNVHKTLWGIESTCSCLLIRQPDDKPLPNYPLWSQIGTDWKKQPEKEDMETE